MLPSVRRPEAIQLASRREPGVSASICWRAGRWVALVAALVVLIALGGGWARPLETAPEITTITRRNAWLRSVLVVDGEPLVHPAKLLVAGNTAFVLDSGSLFRATLIEDGATPLVVRQVMPTSRGVDGAVMHELADLALGSVGTVYALDKMGNVFAYTWTDERGVWKLIRPAETTGSGAASVVLAVSFFDGVVYLLDSGLGQIHRFPATPARGPQFFPRASFDAARGVDLAVDGRVYLLTRSGALRGFAEGLSLDLPPLELASLAPGTAPVPAVPSLIAPPGSPFLYAVDPASSQIIAVDKARWSPVHRFEFAEAGPRRLLQSAAVANGRLWAMVGTDLVAYPRVGSLDVR